jgi:hypothetical protein
MSLQDDIPGYREALVVEREARDYAFLALPRQICGIDVLPLTLRHLVTRFMINCPFLCERTVLDRPDPVGEIGAFIWHVSEARQRTRFSVLSEFHARERQHAILAPVALEHALKEIDEYLDWTFLDAPPSGDGKTETRPSVTSVAATLIDLFASNYGWWRDQVLDAPLVELHQLLREIILRNDPKALLPNRRSGKVRGDFLNAVNAAAAAAAAVAPASVDQPSTISDQPPSE